MAVIGDHYNLLCPRALPDNIEYDARLTGDQINKYEAAKRKCNNQMLNL